MKKRKMKEPQPVTHSESVEVDDEEIPEDEAFNSEDERKYGSFFDKNPYEESNDKSDDTSGDSENDIDSDFERDDEDEGNEHDDDESDDGGQYMLDLLKKLDEGKDKEQNESIPSSSAAMHVSESEFAASVVPKTGLTLDTLMEGIQDTKGFGVMQKTMKKVVAGRPTPAPLSRVVSNRAERKVHYEDQAKEVSLWLDAVQDNRQAETLDFRPQQRMDVTRDSLVDKFVPTTDFEKEIHAALLKAGEQDEEGILKAEEAALQDDLGNNELTMEEYKKRRGQLAKMRALMFYHEQKRHHIKKIKSKKYRRIRKKQRERLKDAEAEAEMQEDPDLAKELEEKEEMTRMQERMTLAHKNTSKWAKRILKRGNAVDVDTRKALSAQLKRGDDLLKKMKSTREADEDDDSDEDLVETARKVLEDAEDTSNPTERGSGLFKLSFMQKGIEKQRKLAQEEARQLLLELEANQVKDDYDLAVEHDDINEQKEAAKEKKSAKEKARFAKEMKEVIKEGELVASSLQMGNSSSIAVSGGIDVNTGLAENTAEGASAGTSISQHTSSYSVSNEDNASEKKGRGKKQKVQNKQQRAGAATSAGTHQNTEENNPWISSMETTDKASKKRGKGRNGKTIDVEGAIDLLDQTAKSKTEKTGNMPDNKTEDDKKITTLTQEELVRKAFVTPSDSQIEEDFAKEKQLIEEEEENPNRGTRGGGKKGNDEPDTVSGWGAWAGEGAPSLKPPNRKLPKKLMPPSKKSTDSNKRKRQDAKKSNVIIREKRVKKTANNYMIQSLPYPFKSREEYETAMAGSLGREWNVTKSFRNNTRPDVVTRAGKIIQPLSQKVKKARPAAKF